MLRLELEGRNRVMWGVRMAAVSLWVAAASPHKDGAARAPASEEEVVCKTAALVVTKRGTLHICLFAISSVSGRILLVTLDCFPASCRFWKVSRSAAMWKALNFKWEQAQCS